MVVRCSTKAEAINQNNSKTNYIVPINITSVDLLVAHCQMNEKIEMASPIGFE